MRPPSTSTRANPARTPDPDPGEPRSRGKKRLKPIPGSQSTENIPRPRPPSKRRPRAHAADLQFLQRFAPERGSAFLPDLLGRVGMVRQFLLPTLPATLVPGWNGPLRAMQGPHGLGRVPGRPAREPAALQIPAAGCVARGGTASRGMLADLRRRAGAAPEAIVAIPHHPSRLRGQGFVPSVLLARALAKKDRSPLLAGALVRIRDTPSQTGLGRRARAANLKGAFRVEVRVPSRIWLVDDVVTTGATFCAAAEVLSGAEALGWSAWRQHVPRSAGPELWKSRVNREERRRDLWPGGLRQIRGWPCGGARDLRAS